MLLFFGKNVGRFSMSNPDLNFESSEYAHRLSLVRSAMEIRSIEVLLVSDPSNMAWITGYDGWSFYTHQCVIVLLDQPPIWFGRGIDRAGALRTVYMGDENIIGYEDHYVQSTERHPMDVLSAIIEKNGWSRRRIGVEMDNYYFSAAAYASLVVHLPNAKFLDATGLVNWQRAVKSARELEYIRNAARIVEAMHTRIFELIRPELKKNELVAEIYHTGITGVEGAGGDYPAIVPMLPSGLDATAPHLTWDDRPLKSGEETFFEIAGCYKRYHCPLSRTVYLGKPPQKYRDAEKAVLEGTEAALEKAKPGNLCEDVAIAFNAAINKHGFSKDNRAGYSIGLSYPPDWGERTMSFRQGDKTVLEENMTFHLMPALWFDNGGLEITESIVITENGAEPLANYPRKLQVKD